MCSLRLSSTRQHLQTVLTALDKVQTQGRNIRHYANYLTERAKAYRDIKVDFARGGENRMEKMTVEKGLLRATEALQEQIAALVKCDVCFIRFWDELG